MSHFTHCSMFRSCHLCWYLKGARSPQQQQQPMQVREKNYPRTNDPVFSVHSFELRIGSLVTNTSCRLRFNWSLSWWFLFRSNWKYKWCFYRTTPVRQTWRRISIGLIAQPIIFLSTCTCFIYLRRWWLSARCPALAGIVRQSDNGNDTEATCRISR